MEKLDRLRTYLAATSGAVSVIIALIALFAYFNVEVFREVDVKTPLISQQINALNERINILQNINDVIKKDIDSITNTIESANINPETLEIAKISAHLQLLSTDIESIKDAFGSEIEKSLSVPLLRKDLIQLKNQIDSRTAAASKEIDRIYDQNKWFLGLMGTMAIGLLGLAVSNFLQARKTGG